MARLVMAATYTDTMDAYIARGRLEAEGIPVALHNENHIATNWLISQAIGGVKIMVAASNLEEATTILQAHEAGEYDIAPEISYSDGLHCPKCDATDIKSGIAWLATFLGFITLGVYALVIAKSRKLHQCRSCKHYWHIWSEKSDTKSLEDELINE